LGRQPDHDWIFYTLFKSHPVEGFLNRVLLRDFFRLSNVFVFTEWIRGMNKSEINFGVIGFGAWGGCHARAIDKVSGARVAALCARSKASCDKARAEFPDAQVDSDWRRLIELDGIDAFVVVVPSFLHFEVASAVLAAGKHLLLEKPMALTTEHCLELVRLAQARDLRLALGHELRLSSLWGKMKALIDEGYIGDPKYALVELSRRPYRPGADGWRYDINRVGDWILEEPIHFFDFARWCLSGCGEPERVYAVANSRQPEHPELQDNFSATVHFKGGAYAVVTQTLAAFEHHQTAKITGTQGALWASWSGAMDRTRHPTFSLRGSQGEEVETFSIDQIPGEIFELEAQVETMVSAIRSGTPVHADGMDGAWSVEMCLAASRSVVSGKVESIRALKV